MCTTFYTLSYDAIGNRLTKTGVPGAWSYNANAELLGFGNTSLQYDPNGNLTNRTNQTNGTNGTNYIYDVSDQLIQVQDLNFNIIADYGYDPFGRRLWKQVDGLKTYFIYSDEGLIAEYSDNGSENKSYGYEPYSTWTTAPIYMKEGENYYFYHNDYLGTPQKMTAINGSLVWSAKYNAFGEANVDPAVTITNNLRMPGQYFDQETGFHYNWHRTYNPKTGRYMETDPIGFAGRNLNLYGYCMNDPINWIDPNGLNRRPVPGAIRGADKGATGSHTGKAGGAYGTDRYNAQKGWYEHTGLDLLAPPGASVYSPIAGTIKPIQSETEAIWICKPNGTICCSRGEGKTTTYKKQICWRLVHVTPMPYLYPGTKVYETYPDVVGTVNGWPNNPDIRPHVHVEIYEDTCVVGRFTPLVRRDPTPDTPPNGRANEEE